MSGGGSGSGQLGFSKSSSTDRGSNVWQPQQQYLQDLYAKAQGQLSNNTNMDTANNQLSSQYGALQGFVNPTEDPRLQMYSNQLGKHFNEQVLPALHGDAIQANGLGNSRNQLAEGYAGSQMNQQMIDYSTNLYGQNQANALQAIQGQNQITGQQSQLPWQNLQAYQGLLGAPINQDLGGTANSHSWSTAGSGSGGGGSSSSGGGSK